MASVRSARLEPASSIDDTEQDLADYRPAGSNGALGALDMAPRQATLDPGKFFLALSDNTRRNILRLLAVRERNVTDIASNFELSQPTISRHLLVLQEANLVNRRREGQHVFYRLDDNCLARAVHEFFGEFEQCRRMILCGSEA